MLDHRRKIQPTGKKQGRDKHMRYLSRMTHTQTRRDRPQEPVEMVIRLSFARFCITGEHDAFDPATVEECGQLPDFAAFVAEDEELGEFDGAGTSCGLGVHEGIFGHMRWMRRSMSAFLFPPVYELLLPNPESRIEPRKGLLGKVNYALQ
ncbi:hypothetical protein BDR06DRAFT_975032 [Suillus hirtellus]|nr:hypothetical protein BDR06DRAFT_975032 [Suillus hirtellus]